MVKTHKLRTENNGFAFTECNIPLHIKGGEVTKDWKFVNCKKCIKKK